MKTFKLLTGLALGAALSGATLAPQAAFAHGDEHQNVLVTIDGKGYHPSTVNVKAGQEVHMTFISKAETCGNNVVIPSLKKTVNLKVGQKKMVAFTPKKGQTIAFSCSMKMFRGSISAK